MPTKQAVKQANTFIIPVRTKMSTPEFLKYMEDNYPGYGGIHKYNEDMKNGKIPLFETFFKNDKNGLEIIENALTKEIIVNEVLLSDKTKKRTLFVVPKSEVSNFKNAIGKGGSFKCGLLTEAERLEMIKKHAGDTRYSNIASLEFTLDFNHDHVYDKNYIYLNPIEDVEERAHLIPKSKAKEYLDNSILK